MKFNILAIAAIVCSIAFATAAKRNKRREPAAGVSSAHLNEKAVAPAAKFGKVNVCTPACSAKQVCIKSHAMGSTFTKCVSEKEAEKYNVEKAATAKSRRRY